MAEKTFDVDALVDAISSVIDTTNIEGQAWGKYLHSAAKISSPEDLANKENARATADIAKEKRDALWQMIYTL